MVENNKSKTQSLWTAVLAVLAVVCVMVQAAVAVEQIEIYKYLEGYTLYRLITFRVIGVVAPLVILVTVLIREYTVALGTLMGYYVIYASIYMAGLFVTPDISITAIVYFVYHLTAAVILLVILAKGMKLSAAFICCCVLQTVWVLYYLCHTIRNINWLGLTGTVASAAILICLTGLMKEEG